MTKWSICPAVAEDAEAIAALNESCLGVKYPVEAVRKQLKALIDMPNERVFVAVYRGKMLGYIHASGERKTYHAPQKVIRVIAVDKAFRRQGVGTSLWKAVEEWALSERCEGISALVGSSKSAQAFCAAQQCTELMAKRQFSKPLVKKADD